MDAYFNELSCYPLADSKDDLETRINSLATFLAAAKYQGFNVVRCHDRGISDIRLSKDITLADYVNMHLRDTRCMLICSMFKAPYFLPNSPEEERYIVGNYFHSYKKDSHFSQEEIYGLAAAYLNKSLGVNLRSSDYWSDNKEYELIEVIDGKKRLVKVLAFSSPEDFNSAYYEDWLVTNTPAEFEDCKIPSDKKICNLSSDHHGNSELKSFAKTRLFNLPYITKVVTSLPYNPHCRTFVSDCHTETKRLEVVLHWTEKGYSMLVQTTARTVIELKQIAVELEKMFG